MLGNTYEGQDCAIARSLEVIGERWTLLVLRDALYGVRRFSDFAEHLDIPRAVLSDRLRKLAANGVLKRVQAKDEASAIYELTAAGRDLWPVVHALAHWGQRHAGASKASRTFVHASCGMRLDAFGRCPRCGIGPDVSDVISMPGRAATRRTDRVAVALAGPRRMLEPI